MKLTFFGGVRSVTGSMHLLEVGGAKVLIDCGLFFGRRKETWERNRNFPFDIKSLDALVLSHAHIDHAGNIPGIVKQGFKKPVFTSLATRNLCSVMLKDSAHIQTQDAEYLNKKNREKGLPPIAPLYEIRDAEDAMNYFVGLSYGNKMLIAPGVELTFFDAGHILGSAISVFDLEENGRRLRLAYVVDLGRKRLPLLKDPTVIDDANIMMIESTYGNRLHGTFDDAEKKLASAIQRTCKRKGKVIIPAFALGRTQELLYCLRRLIERKEIPPLPIYVDSPLAVNVTEVFRIHSELFDEETKKMLSNGVDPFQFKSLTYVRKVEDSKAIHKKKGPMVIISAAGMCETGRILHHLKNNIENPRNTVMVVSFMAENTLGRRIVEREKKVKIFGEEYKMAAEVVIINAFSAHADRDDLINYVRRSDSRTEKVIVVHGEEDQSLSFAEHIQNTGIKEILVPERGDSLKL